MSLSQDRIVAVDLLRGFALLGILVMNIASFALPSGSYYNPMSFEPTLLNRVIHGISHLLADQKMMAIFSMLFGASMILLMEKTESAGRKFGSFFCARTSWLLLFGVLHYAFLWEGDILALYAFCGFILFLFRRIPAKIALILGVLLFLTPITWAPAVHGDFLRMDEVEVASVEKWWAPSSVEIEKDVEILRGPYLNQIAHRFDDPGSSEKAESVSEWPALTLALEAFFRALGAMLMGTALFRLGFLTGRLSPAFYHRVLILGFSLGLPIASFGLWQYHANNFDFEWSLTVGRAPNHIATILLAAAYISMIMLWSHSPRWPGFKTRLSAVGRMAFSNYIGQTMLATALFYGWGMGLYARLNRLELLLVMVLIWILQLLISPWWLARFRYGPLEWLWRTLCYWKLQPIRK